mmetsp:Transcript_22671/g.65293  ORF Transcript_22671/g.65293 Transcript_22671/m.65293 type:complete len:281 (+) Transcript_22671:3156-3998(+)
MPCLANLHRHRIDFVRPSNGLGRALVHSPNMSGVDIYICELTGLFGQAEAGDPQSIALLFIEPPSFVKRVIGMEAPSIPTLVLLLELPCRRARRPGTIPGQDVDVSRPPNVNFCQQLQTEGIVLVAIGAILSMTVLAVQPLEAIVRCQRPIDGRSIDQNLGSCRRSFGSHLSQPFPGRILLHGHEEGVLSGNESLPIDGGRQQPLMIFGQPICRLRWRRCTDAHEDLEVGVLGRGGGILCTILLLLPLIEQLGQLSLHSFFVVVRVCCCTGLICGSFWII